MSVSKAGTACANTAECAAPETAKDERTAMAIADKVRLGAYLPHPF
jgi:hypothetical protein